LGVEFLFGQDPIVVNIVDHWLGNLDWWVFVIKLLLGLIHVPNWEHDQLDLLFFFVAVVNFLAVLLFGFPAQLFLLLFV
jgi:hypothetical protein